MICLNLILLLNSRLYWSLHEWDVFSFISKKNRTAALYFFHKLKNARYQYLHDKLFWNSHLFLISFYGLLKACSYSLKLLQCCFLSYFWFSLYYKHLFFCDPRWLLLYRQRFLVSLYDFLWNIQFMHEEIIDKFQMVILKGMKQKVTLSLFPAFTYTFGLINLKSQVLKIFLSTWLNSWRGKFIIQQ